MTMYYRVKPEKDQTPIYKNSKFDNILVGGELITASELKKMQQHNKHLCNISRYFDVVECSRKNSYFMFGARFNTEIKKKWLLECSIDAVDIDYSEVLESELEPDFWTCYSIAADHRCEFWTVSEYVEV